MLFNNHNLRMVFALTCFILPQTVVVLLPSPTNYRDLPEVLVGNYEDQSGPQGNSADHPGFREADLVR